MTRLVRFRPSYNLRNMQSEFDRLFSNFLPATQESDEEGEVATWSPRLDARETEEAYLFEFDVPGLSKDEIQVNFQNGTLTVSGDRKSREVTENENLVRVERFFGSFYRSFELPTPINEKKIEAKYTDGVLFLTVPKRESSKPHRIQIN